ncbi:Ig-like domain-containing protein [Treponema primitia]|uniref:Ig-like domain-containing protein n=1 Tax=Treponema primitia TaxID=88058 RepID=UPI000255506F|nr:Ig-like domain-containing protein [Treponema primitia]
MKKRFGTAIPGKAALVAMLVFVMALVSCGDKDSGDPLGDGPDKELPDGAIDTRLIGTWKDTEDGALLTVTFQSNGTVSWGGSIGSSLNAAYQGGGQFAWIANNGTISYQYSNPPQTVDVYGYSINGAGELILTASGVTVVTLSKGSFVAVYDIIDVPTSVVVGTTLTLSGTVSPSNATNQTIVWSVANAGATGAVISNGNSLTTTGEGNVTITATITNGLQNSNYTQSFTITVTSDFVPVTGINDVPSSATEGVPLVLSGTVMPSNATNQTIVWSVPSGNNATITDGILTKTTSGSVNIYATIINGKLPSSDYTQSFYIYVNSMTSVYTITGVPTSTTAGIPLALSGTVSPSNATNQTIVWSVANAGTTGAAIIDGNSLTTTAGGTAIITATIINGKKTDSYTIANYTQDFTIIVIPTNSISLSFTDESGGAFNQGSFTISKGNAMNNTKTISLVGSWVSKEWRVDTVSKGTGDSFIVNAADYTTGTHTLGVRVFKDSVPWTKNITFTVTE